VKQQNVLELVVTGEALRDHLRRSPGSRSLLYLSGAVAITEVLDAVAKHVGGFTLKDERTRPVAAMALRWSHCLVGVGWTAVCAKLKGQAWPAKVSRADIGLAVAGAGGGISAYLLTTAVAAQMGWVSAPAWGWERVPLTRVLEAMLIQGATHVAIAVSEETVFRGYGFDQLRAALGTVPATGVMTALFALYHGRVPIVLLDTGVGALLLTSLRLTSDSLSLPIGYHFGWNIAQTALLGPTEGPPSLRPRVVTGPGKWVGQPDGERPGLLGVLLHIALIIGIVVAQWRRRRRSTPTSAWRVRRGERRGLEEHR
jgi:membrane protease YdiL (CAAX protease family)